MNIWNVFAPVLSVKNVLYKQTKKYKKCVYMGQFQSWIGKWSGIGTEKERQSLPGGQVAQLWCQVNIYKSQLWCQVNVYKGQLWCRVNVYKSQLWWQVNIYKSQFWCQVDII